MGGTNPYLEPAAHDVPRSPYRLTFLPANVTIDVDPTALPEGGDGLPGSILSLAQANRIDLDHACGGVCACSTCHVIVRSGESSLPPSSEGEDDMLDLAPGVEPGSRLGCQAVPDGSCDVVVEIPPWNRNMAREG